MPAPIAADLAGRTILVTGGNAGIGKQIALALAGLRARVVLACRSRERGEAARQELANATGNPTVELMLVELGSQASIRAFAQTFVPSGIAASMNTHAIQRTARLYGGHKIFNLLWRKILYFFV